MDIALLLGYAGTFLTAVVGTYLANSIRRKNDADAAASLTDAAMKMVQEKGDDLAESKKELTMWKIYTQYLMAGCQLLRQQLIKEKIDPLFNPTSLEEYMK